MKLIIDISEEDYAETMYRKQHTPRDMDWADKIISNGTLLDDVKAEIDKLHKVGNGNDGRVYVPINDVFDVIDKHIGKAESESE